MKIGKVQHYADEAYLSLFADSEGRLHAACRLTGAPSITRPKATAYENFLYTRSHLGAMFDREAQKLESRIGSAFGPGRARMRDALIAGSDADRRLICRYLLLNAMRNPAFRDMAANGIKQPLDDRRTSEAFISRAITQMHAHEPELLNMYWTLHVAPEGLGWIATDMPVQVGFDDSGLDNVIAPLTPRLLLWCRRKARLFYAKECMASSRWVGWLNGRLAKTALRWIYGPNPEVVRLAFAEAQSIADLSPYDDCAQHFQWEYRSVRTITPSTPSPAPPQ